MTFLSTTDYKIHYRERTTAIAKHLEKLILKKTKIEAHVKFLKHCKDQNLIPKGFVIKKNTDCYKNYAILLNTMIRMRNNTLNFKYKQLKLYNTEIQTQKTILNIYMKSIQPNQNHEQDLHWIKEKEIKRRNKINKAHEKTS